MEGGEVGVAAGLSPLAMAEWIEMEWKLGITSWWNTSPLAMAEWIEIGISPEVNPAYTSPLAMAEWIEISCAFARFSSE